MEWQRRLSRAQVLERLREHERRRGFVSYTFLDNNDRILLRSLPLYFLGLDAARCAAGVKGPPHSRPSKGKPGSRLGMRGKPKARSWSRQRVIEELRRLAHKGCSTKFADLMESGHVTLVHAAMVHAGGLTRARAVAGIKPPKRRDVKPHTWTQSDVLTAIRKRWRSRQTLAASYMPQNLYTAARTHFGNWRSALVAAGIAVETTRIDQRKWTKPVILDGLRRAAAAGNDLRAKSLSKIVSLAAVHREFGTLEAAIRAAGLGRARANRPHSNRKWTPERVLHTIRERASRGEHTLTAMLHRGAQLFFGGAARARAAAGVPNPTDLRRRARDQRSSGAPREAAKRATGIIKRGRRL